MDKAYDRKPTIRSRELRNSPTDAEKKLWSVLRNRQILGVRFNRQVPVGPYICDFVARSLKLVIEIDGGQHAALPSDASRTRFLESRGYRVLRFWNNHVLGNIDGVVTEIERILRHMPSPTPPAAGRGF